MQVNSSADTAKVASGGANKRSIKFGISNNTDFLHILSNIYSRPLEATCREPICNAWDSHLASGKKDVPIHITITEDKFVIRDFGAGIDPDIIEDVYAVYGNSTKKDCVLSTGGFGLGCKAPFTYVDSFTVASYYNGTKTVYSLIKGDINHNGETTMNEIVAVPTTETGVEVIIPIVDGTSYEITRLCKALCFTGSIKARINGKLVALEPIKLDSAGEYHLVTPTEYSEYQCQHLSPVNVQYGNMTYPVIAPDDTKSSFNFTFFRWLRGYCERNNKKIIIKAEADSLNIVPSREALNYTPYTIDQLNELLVTTVNNLIRRRKEQFDIVLAYWETKPVLRNNIRSYCLSNLYNIDQDNFRFYNTLIFFNNDMNLFEYCDLIQYDLGNNSRYALEECKSLEERDLFAMSDIKGIKGREYGHLTRIVIGQYLDTLDPYDGMNAKVNRLLNKIKADINTIGRSIFRKARSKEAAMYQIFKMLVRAVRGIPINSVYIKKNDGRRAQKLLTVIKSWSDFDRWMKYLANNFKIEIIRTVAETDEFDDDCIFVIAKNKEQVNQYMKLLSTKRCVPNADNWEAREPAKPTPKAERKPSRRLVKKFPIKITSALDMETRANGDISSKYEWQTRITNDDITKEPEWYVATRDINADFGSHTKAALRGTDFNLGCLPNKLLPRGCVVYTDEQLQFCKDNNVKHISEVIFELAKNHLNDPKVDKLAREEMLRHLIQRDDMHILATLDYKGLTPNYIPSSVTNITHFVSKVINVGNNNILWAKEKLAKVKAREPINLLAEHHKNCDMWYAEINLLYVTKYAAWMKAHKRFLTVYNEDFVDLFDELYGFRFTRGVKQGTELNEQILMLADFVSKITNRRIKTRAVELAAKLEIEAEVKTNDSNEES